MKKYFALIFIFLLLLGPLSVLFRGEVDLHAKWQTANRASAHLAPLPSAYPAAVVQVYAARAFSWRGLFAVHTWLAVKSQHAKSYTVYQVVGWNQYYHKPVLVITQDIPDRFWFSHKPHVVFDLRGSAAQKVIPEIAAAAKNYPYQHTYYLWPGPNSNTFVAYIARQVPQLDFAMPVLAIGKDFLPKNGFFARTPDEMGYQFSVYGLFGILVSKESGLELNILGLVIGINPLKLALAWPGIGWFGLHQ